MATTKTPKRKLKQLNDLEIILLYMNDVLEMDIAPKNVYVFCKKNNIDESNFYSFSYDMQDSKLASVSVKNDDKFLVYIYNAEKKSLYPEVSVTNSFNFITTKLNLFNTTGSSTMAQIAKDMIPRLYTIDEKNYLLHIIDTSCGIFFFAR